MNTDTNKIEETNGAKPFVRGSLPPMLNPDENNGWNFDYKLLERVADAASEIEEGVSMEDVDAILTVLWRQ